MTINRRHFIQLGSAVAAALAAGSISACSDEEATSMTTDGSSDTARADAGSTTVVTEPAAVDTTGVAGDTTFAPAAPGGTVRVSLLAAPTDTLDPGATTGVMDYAVLYSVHDSLVLLKGDQFVMQLAESITPNDDGSEWTVVLREGVNFHDGARLTSADVIYSLNLYAASPSYGQFFAFIDFPNVSATDELTVVLPLVTPRADLVESVLAQMSIIVQDGFTDWGGNVGTGPFVLESYEPGVGASVVRNAAYWNGAPSLERVEFISIADAATKVNALTSGEIDYASGLDAAAAATLEGADGVQVLRGDPTFSTIRCIAFNKQQAPFDDPTVIEACKLAVDRQQMIDVVAFGNARLGNDMPALGFVGYPTDLPQRERDVAMATELFAAAGVTEFTIRAADFVPGIVASAELFAQQLAECGVNVAVDKGDAATYFTDFAQVLSTPCQSFYFINRPALTLLSSYTGSAAGFNVFGGADPTYDAALSAAVATIDEGDRTEQVVSLLEMVRDTEGWLIWGFEDAIDAAVSGLSGVEISQSVPGFATATLV